MTVPSQPTDVWHVTENYWSINRSTENTQITSVNNSPPPKSANCLYGKSKAFGDVYLWSAVCDVLLLRCGHNDNQSATQPEHLWGETKPSLYKYSNIQIYTQFPSCSTLFESSSEQVTVGDWQTCCLVSFISYRIVCKLLNFEQEEKWNLYFLKTVRYLPCFVSSSDANEGNWLKNWNEFEILFHGQEWKSVPYKVQFKYGLHQSGLQTTTAFLTLKFSDLYLNILYVLAYNSYKTAIYFLAA